LWGESNGNPRESEAQARQCLGAMRTFRRAPDRE
jgi:hypothetical protein